MLRNNNTKVETMSPSPWLRVLSEELSLMAFKLNFMFFSLLRVININIAAQRGFLFFLLAISQQVWLQVNEISISRANYCVSHCLYLLSVAFPRVCLHFYHWLYLVMKINALI